MNYAEIKKYDIANGEGVRVSLFVSGCTHHCPECFNEVAWDFNYGQPFTAEVMEDLLQTLTDPYIDGLSLLGGEPFEPENQEGLLPFLRQVKKRLPDKTIWCYSGYLLDKQLLPDRLRSDSSADGNSESPAEKHSSEQTAYTEITEELLSYMDVLVDGPFVAAKKDISLAFRGSSNQRIIDVKKTLRTGGIIWWKPELYR